MHTVAAAALEEVVAATDAATLDAVRSRYLGRGDGLLTVFRKRIGVTQDADARRALGQTVNALVERVTEAIDAASEEFGEGRLLACATEQPTTSPVELLDRVLSTTRAFCGSTPQVDDITVVVDMSATTACDAAGRAELARA